MSEDTLITNYTESNNGLEKTHPRLRSSVNTGPNTERTPIQRWERRTETPNGGSRSPFNNFWLERCRTMSHDGGRTSPYHPVENTFDVESLWNSGPRYVCSPIHTHTAYHITSIFQKKQKSPILPRFSYRSHMHTSTVPTTRSAFLTKRLKVLKFMSAPSAGA